MLRLGQPAGTPRRRFERICGLVLVTSLIFQLYRLALYSYEWMQPGLPLQYRLSGLQKELFPYHMGLPFLIWACVEHLRPLEEGVDGRRQLKRRAWALIGWLSSEMIISTYDAWLLGSRDYSLAVYVGDLVLPAARFAVQVLVCAMTAALGLQQEGAPVQAPERTSKG
jgi:hypothetical protein